MPASNRGSGSMTRSRAGTVRPRRSGRKRPRNSARIEALPADLRRAAYELARRFRQQRNPAVWSVERVGLEGEDERVGLSEQDLDKAAQWFQGQQASLRGIVAREGSTGDKATWFRRVLHRLPR